MAVLSRSASKERKYAAVFLAIAIAMVSMPAIYGFAIVGPRCSITADICHPLQSLNSSTPPSFAPPSAALEFAVTSAALPVEIKKPVDISRPLEAPDPPPPESRA